MGGCNEVSDLALAHPMVEGFEEDGPDRSRCHVEGDEVTEGLLRGRLCDEVTHVRQGGVRVRGAARRHREVRGERSAIVIDQPEEVIGVLHAQGPHGDLVYVVGSHGRVWRGKDA